MTSEKIEISRNFEPLERKLYYEDSSPSEIKALKSRLFLYKPNILYYREVPLQSEFSVQLFFNEITKHLKHMNNAGVLVDLRESEMPNPKIRRSINKGFVDINKYIDHVAYCIGGNLIIKIAARFVMLNTKLDSYSIHSSIEAAEESLNKNIMRT